MNGYEISSSRLPASPRNKNELPFCTNRLFKKCSHAHMCLTEVGLDRPLIEFFKEGRLVLMVSFRNFKNCSLGEFYNLLPVFQFKFPRVAIKRFDHS